MLKFMILFLSIVSTLCSEQVSDAAEPTNHNSKEAIQIQVTLFLLFTSMRVLDPTETKFTYRTLWLHEPCFGDAVWRLSPAR